MINNKYVKCIRLYSDGQGESHFEDIEIELNAVDFAPPSPPLNLSSYTPAKQFAFLNAPVGWESDWHPAPYRQIHFYMSGEVEAEVSDGETRHLSAGDIVMVEDTSGKGHRSRTIGSSEILIATVQLE